MLNIIVCIAVATIVILAVCGVEIAVSDRYCEKIGSMY